MKSIATLLAVVALGAGSVYAVDLTKPKHESAETFKQLDKNNDGALTIDEYKAGPAGMKDPAKAEETFKKHDKNHDGKLTQDEFASVPANHSKKDAAKAETKAETTAKPVVK